MFRASRLHACTRKTQRMIAAAIAEPLEARRLLAGIESGVLVARGTAGADTIFLRRTGTDDVIVTTNGVSQQFDMDNFTGVRLEGLGGDDTFNLIDPLVSPLVRNTTVLGSAGRDTISYATRTGPLEFVIDPLDPDGSSMTSGPQLDRFNGIEVVIGGSAGDRFIYGQSWDLPPELERAFFYRLEGRGGNDTFLDRVWPDGDAYGAVSMFGGDGDDAFGDESDHRMERDFFFGEAGNDRATIYDDPNDGVIDGGTGIDTMNFHNLPDESPSWSLSDFPNFENADADAGSIAGTDANNVLRIFSGGTLNGGNGDDTVIGSTDDDLLIGGPGNDSVLGLEGNDTLEGEGGVDTLNGGPGDDRHIDGEVITDPDVEPSPTNPTIVLRADRVLHARGTSGNDTFTLRRVGTDNVIVTVNAVSAEFDMDDFSGVLFEGLGGDDAFRMTNALVSPVVRNVTVYGGSGADVVDYSTRTGAMRFNGYEDPEEIDPSMTLPFIEAFFGAQKDHIASDVDSIVAGSGNDTFNVTDDQRLAFNYPIPGVSLDGRGGNDNFGPSFELNSTQIGGAGDDFFSVDESSAEWILAGDGNDRVEIDEEAVASADFGAGNDTLDVQFSHKSLIDMNDYAGLENVEGAGDFVRTVIGNALNNRITTEPSSEVNVTLRGLGGNDTLVGSQFGDLLEGGDGNDSILANGGDDTLIGGSGNDTLDGGAGFDFADGGSGTNTHRSIEARAGTSAPASIAIVNGVLTGTGTVNPDRITIYRTGTDNVTVTIGALSRQFDMDDFTGVSLVGLGGNDIIIIEEPIVSGSLSRKVTVQGGGGADAITGADSDDVLRGGDGNDTIHGGFGNDALFGDGGNDDLEGNVGADFHDGGEGDDFIDSNDFPTSLSDTVRGGNGNDTARVDSLDDVSGVEQFS